jgi:putative membrane protein
MFQPRTAGKAISAAAIFLFAAASASAQTSAQPATGKSSAPAASSGKTSTQGAPGVSGNDRKFMEKTAQHGIAEVKMGELAQQKASNPQVKEFGARMVADHGKANEELKKLASSKGLQLPTDTDKEHQSKMSKMQDKSGADFDKAYMADMVADHKKDVSEFKKQAKAANDPELKAFAEKTLPTLEDHLKLAQQTDKAVKGGTKGGDSAKTAGKSATTKQ